MTKMITIDKEGISKKFEVPVLEVEIMDSLIDLHTPYDLDIILIEMQRYKIPATTKVLLTLGYIVGLKVAAFHWESFIIPSIIGPHNRIN